MKKFQRIFNVVPSLPETLQPLEKIARNVWFAWNKEAIKLFQRLDPLLWRETGHNPMQLLRSINQDRVEEVAKDEGFLAQIERVSQEFDQYVRYGSVYHFHLDHPLDFQIAYFSAEYGLADCLPLYSGGLGVLAGDHLKSASDLGIPLVAVGLLYQKGFFSQVIDEEGLQRETYPSREVENLPICRVTDEQGVQISIHVDLAGRPTVAKLWKINVGRVALYLLDTDTPENNHEYRNTSEQLYGGDNDMRVRQEILLGIGGIRALQRLGLKPSVFHMNEGHAAFVALERIRQLVKEEGLSFRQARDAVTSQCVFTTHTPVPAGNDRFDRALMEKYFRGYAHDLGISFDEFMALGRENPHDPNETFCMTVLALKLSCKANGVSELHSQVSRTMWKKVWPALPLEELPITHITNGVHIPSWVSVELSGLYDRYLGPQWSEDPDCAKVWERVEDIPESELWRTHCRRREALVAFARRNLREQLIKNGAHKSEIRGTASVLDPDALTIGFARRFATYKRGNLIFRDPERLARILNDKDRPVQIVFAGKAHPKDNLGKEIIRSIIKFSKQPEFLNKIVFLEDYNMNIARFMVQGTDVWLNNPLRPLEACGTSGMKAAVNGSLNLSIPDGWWCEGYSGENGWSIGRGEEYQEREYQDEVESRNIYNLLEQEVVPIFYERGIDNVPRKWVALMKNCLRSICPEFNSHRMIENYAQYFYLPSAEKWKVLSEPKLEGGRRLSDWLQGLKSRWDGIKITAVRYENGHMVALGDCVRINVEVFLNGLQPEEVAVDLYHGQVDSRVNFLSNEISKLDVDGCIDKQNYIFSGKIPCRETGRYGFVVRILPKHENLISPYQTGLVLWG